MPDFRYAQFCPLARAAEILGERWTLLVVRDLMMGPQRFSDLRGSLPGVSSSVLAERLARLEERGIVARRRLPPPAPATVYELGESGRALERAIVELSTWGARFLGLPLPGDDLPPRALRLGLHFLAKKTATPARRFAVRVPDRDAEVRFRVVGGDGGTRVTPEEGPADVEVCGHPFALAALAAGRLDPAAALRDGTLRAEGDTDALADFPLLFDLKPPAGTGAAGVGSPNPKGN